jgi:transcriptional regulator
MYLPRHFAEDDPATLHALVRAHPLGTWVTRGDDVPGGITADHVPFMLDTERGPHGLLRCHVARANPVWQRVAAAPDAMSLVVFQGADAYISPSWYATKREHGKVVPTWNYATVHVHGLARVVDDAAWLRALVETLTATHEAPRAQPWAVGDAPADYVEAMLRAIVGIEIPIMSITGKWKVGQNHPAANQRGVAEALEGGGTNTGTHTGTGTTAREMASLVRARIRNP